MKRLLALTLSWSAHVLAGASNGPVFTTFDVATNARWTLTSNGWFATDARGAVRFPPSGFTASPPYVQFVPGTTTYVLIGRRHLDHVTRDVVEVFDERHRLRTRHVTSGSFEDVWIVPGGYCFQERTTTPVLRCFDAASNREFYRERASAGRVSPLGEAYFSPSAPARYRPEATLRVVNVRSGASRVVTFDTTLVDANPAASEDFAALFEGRRTAWISAPPVAGARVVNIGWTSPGKVGSVSAVYDADFRFRAALPDKDGEPYESALGLIVPSRTGRFLVGGTNAIRVWDREKGYALAWYLTDASWGPDGDPFPSYFVDEAETRLLVLARSDESNATASVFDLSTGRRLSTFAVRHPPEPLP